ncbi:DUF2252 domain-containing protein [Pseudonocardia pini]|uniref:DUF2252 domain-containing protein n=1 Tax=Pseudonocardia pini TaxID=2758030 RepID=UPI0015F0EA7B|nr:DUF2252 domain-containing protein [Pseudonocardia pini]
MRPHTVLASLDPRARDGFALLSAPALPREARQALGRELREQVPREALAAWSPANRRIGAVDSVVLTNEGRVERLVPIRIGRMAANPYAFLRGAAHLHAADFSTLPATGIQPVICGDAHLGNFGFYASPERELVFDLNDFDEAHPGAWEWDLRRLAASIHVAGRVNAATEQQCEAAVANCVDAYRRHLRRLATAPLLGRSYERIDAEDLHEQAPRKSSRRAVAEAARKARRRTSDRALPRFTTGESRRIVDDPPLIVRPEPDRYDRIMAALDAYLATLPSHWARVVGGYRVVDVAHKVVGVGSVGLRAYLALCEGSGPDDVLFLQLKQARRSVVAPFVHGQDAWHDHQGQRVVEYQQALQTVSDPLLGWTTVGDHQYYVRQFRDMKGAIVLDGIDAVTLGDYAAICGLLLAKGHARTSGASMIGAYLGGGGRVRTALCRFARAYADQTERDYAELTDAVRRGLLPSEPGV